MESYLEHLVLETGAEEAILFERATFLTVTSVEAGAGEQNPYPDRHERLSNVIKTFKQSLSLVGPFSFLALQHTELIHCAVCRNYTNNPTTSHPFTEFALKAPRFNLILSRLTNNTYVLLVVPPGDTDIECARLNIMMARERFVRLDVGMGNREPDRT